MTRKHFARRLFYFFIFLCFNFFFPHSSFVPLLIYLEIYIWRLISIFPAYFFLRLSV